MTTDLVDRVEPRRQAPVVRDRRSAYDLVGVLGALRRYWWIVVPALLLTLGLAYKLPSKNTSPWQSQASLFLVGPTADGSVPANPYLSGHIGLLTTTGLLESAVKANVSVQHDSRQIASTVDISVPNAPPQPLLQVVVNGPSEERSQADLANVIQVAKQQLEQIQNQDDVSNATSVDALSVEYTAPHQTPISRSRPTAAIAFLGVALTVWFVLILDRRRSAGQASAPVPAGSAVES